MCLHAAASRAFGCTGASVATGGVQEGAPSLPHHELPGSALAPQLSGGGSSTLRPPQPLPPSLYPRNLLLPKRLRRQSPAQAAWRGVPGGWWGSINLKQHGEGVGDQ